MLLLWQDRPCESSGMEPTKTDMELLSNSMATYAHIKGNYGNRPATRPRASGIK